MKTTVEQMDRDERTGLARVRLTIEVPFDELVYTGPEPGSGRRPEPAPREAGSVPGDADDPLDGVPLEPALAFADGEFAGESLPPAFVTAVSAKMHDALREHAVVPLRHPEVRITGFGDGVALTASMVVELRPEIELPKLASIEIELPAPGNDAGLVEKWVDARLEGMRKEFVDLTPVDREARPGDFLRLDLRAAVGDGAEAGWEPADDVHVELGSAQNLDELNAALAGLKAGQQTTITTRVPSGPDEGRQARVTVTVKAVLRAREAELDDEFAAAASPHQDIARLRAALRDRLDRERRADLLVAARDAALAAVITAVGLDPVPELSRLIVLDALADEERIQVTADELRDVVAYEMGRSGVSARTYRKYLARDGVAVQLYEHARREKALIHLLKQVVIRDADGNIVLFDDLAAN